MAEVMGGIDGWFIADKIVAYLFIVLFIWGASNKFGKRDEFNEDFTSLAVFRRAVRFCATTSKPCLSRRFRLRR